MQKEVDKKPLLTQQAFENAISAMWPNQAGPEHFRRWNDAAEANCAGRNGYVSDGNEDKALRLRRVKSKTRGVANMTKQMCGTRR